MENVYPFLSSESIIDLPPFQSIECVTGRSPYGAMSVAAAYCGLKSLPDTMRGNWQHGVNPSFRKPIHPNMLFGANTFSNEQYWVARKDEAAYLRSEEYQNVGAIGMPLVYVPRREVQRRPRSLLVMPAHSLEHTTHRWRFDEYADEIAAIRSCFSEVVVCVHPSCWKNGYWVDAFRARGFPLLPGARLDDRNALERIFRLLSTFEYVTTNSFGSQITYGRYLGAKLSIFGSYAECQADDYKTDPFYRANPQILDYSLQTLSESSIRKQYADLFCHPIDAKQNIEWGHHEIGADNKVNPSRMREIFGWTVRERAWRSMTSVLPEPIKHVGKLLLRPSFRQHRKEINRLRRTPSSTRTTTDLLGKPFEVVDAGCFLHMREEILEQEIYRFAAPTVSPRIIDCGANIGLSIYYFKNLYPNSKITAFEPDPAIFSVLNKNCDCFGFGDVQLIQKAIWINEDGMQLAQEGRDASRLAIFGGDEKLIPVQTCRLTTFLDQKVDFLKIDIEGAETDVLLDCTGSLHNVENVFVEYHSFADEPQRLDELITLLTRSGFRLQIHHVGISRRPFVHRRRYLGMDLQLNIFAFRV